MFTVDYAEGYANLPRLLSDDNLVPDGTRAGLERRAIVDNEDGLLFIADNLDTIVEFGYIDRKDNNKWWSSRAGVFNTPGVVVDGKRLTGNVAIIAVVCYSCIQHFHLDFVRRKIAECGQDIRFFRVTEFEGREVYYIPYEPHMRSFVLNKLEKAHSVFDIEDLN